MTVKLSQYVSANRDDILRNMQWQTEMEKCTPVEFMLRKRTYIEEVLPEYGIEKDISTEEAMIRIFGD